MRQRILCLEDNAEVQIILNRSLTSKFNVTLSSSIQEAREELKNHSYSGLILDIGLPDGDGLRFCSELKANKKFEALPIFILTANTDFQEKSLGFQLGIEDYIAKPFNPEELLLRVDSRIKKITQSQEQKKVFSIGNLNIDYSSQKASLLEDNKNSELLLSTTEFKILAYLSSHPEQVISREQILSTVWGNDIHLSDRTVDSHICRIRKKLNTKLCTITAVQNSGYRFTLKSN